MRPSLRALVTVVAVVGTLHGWVGPASAEPINVFVGLNPHFSVFFVAEKMDLFRTQGVDVKLTGFPSGTAATEAFRAGRGEMVGAGDLPSIRLWQRGEGVGVAPWVNVCKMQVVAGRADLGGPADLRGKTIGTVMGSTSEFFLQKYLATGGLTATDVKVKNLAPADLVVALTRRDIDAFVWADPWGMQAVQASQGKVRIMSYGCGHFTEYMVLTASPQAVKTRGADIVKVLRAVKEAGDFTARNLDASAKIVAERLKLDVALTSELLPRFNWSVAHSRTFRADMNSLAAFMTERKVLENPIDWKTMFDPRFLREVDRALVEE